MYNDALNVDLAELRESAGKLKNTAADLNTAHGAVHSKIADLVTEFGDSAGAAALRGRLAEWEAETQPTTTRSSITTACICGLRRDTWRPTRATPVASRVCRCRTC
ncbi:Uncharacterised protein [Mycobacteroides abscessus subsp. abscessus]|nr:Uncharacterised protein [Mycobacteroides abscessus subsp. abscessus]